MKRFVIPFLFCQLHALTVVWAQNAGDANQGPIDIRATAETKHLLNNLKKSAQKGTIFGHQDDLDYGVGWKEKENGSDVKDVAGDYPGVFGWEIGNIEHGKTHQLDSVSFDKMRGYIQKTFALGAVTTISWHANNPSTGGSAWDTSSHETVKSILPDGANHEKYKEWLDRVAVFIKSLKDTNGTPIPVLFRPFHELTGSWFWWGRKLCTSEEYKQLWRFTVSYLRDQKQVHQLLYIYSTDVVKDEADYMERYPGDAFVDGFGIDIYHRNNQAGTALFRANIKRGLGLVSSLAREKNKFAAFTETGLEQVVLPKWWTDVLWSEIHKYKMAYVLVWRNAYNRPNHYYAPYPGQASAENFKAFEKEPHVFFLKDLKNMYE